MTSEDETIILNGKARQSKTMTDKTIQKNINKEIKV